MLPNIHSSFLDKTIFLLRQANKSQATPVGPLLPFYTIRWPRPQTRRRRSPEEVLVRISRIFVQDWLRGIDLPVFQLETLAERALAKVGVFPVEEADGG